MWTSLFRFALSMTVLSVDAQVSPRLAALEKDVNAHGASAVGQFWLEVQQQGAPIVEAIDRDSQNVLVTYLWRGSSGVRTVVVLGDGTPGDPKDNQLTLMGGTDVWYRSYRYRIDIERMPDSIIPCRPTTPLRH